MIKNFLITIYRNLIRSKFYSALNIIGLSIGLACAILIVLFLRNELSYDKYNVNHKRIVRLGNDFTVNGKNDRVAASALPMGPTLKQEFPEIEEFVRLWPTDRQQFKYGENVFYEEDIAFADSSLFKVFTFELISGDPARALTQPYTMAISQRLAKKYFGDQDPLNKVILVGDDQPYTITAVFRDLPRNTHMRFEAFRSMKTMEQIRGNEQFNSIQPISFWSYNVYTYFLINENCTIDLLAEKFPSYFEKYMKSFSEQYGIEYRPVFQYLGDIHLHSDLMWDAPTGNVKYIYILSAVAIFLLLIASINYMNMATARSSKRAKEVGVRKVVGAVKGVIMRQFLIESIVLTFMALGVAVLFVELILPGFNNLVNKELVLNFKETPDVILFLIGMTLALGLFSGSYPSFFLSSFVPAQILKGKNGSSGSSGKLRKLLVVFQFSISALMISGTLIVASQLFYMNSKDMGFEKEDILVTTVRDSVLRTRMDAFKRELLKNPNVKKIAAATQLIGAGVAKTVHLYEGDTGMEQYALNFMVVDFDYLDLMGMRILEGRKFSKEFPSDSTEAFIVNQAAMRRFGWSEGVGKKMQLGLEFEGEDNDNIRRGEVVGVLSDFHYQPLKNQIEPVSMIVTEAPFVNRVLHIKINSRNREETISYIRNIWSDFCPNYEYNYAFLDEKLKENYDSEERLSHIFIGFSLISILIAALGLFGLSSFMAEQRTKELGVRKVLGASVGHLVLLLTNEFLRLVIVANLLAIPIAYWSMTKWLNDFPYHTEIKIWVFMITLLVSLIIALSTVAWQSLRAANGDPVVALKYE